MSELLYRVALTKIPKVGAVTTKNLISHCGSARAVFEAKRKELLDVPNVGLNIADSIINQNVLHWAEKEVEYIEKNNIKVLFHTDADYPKRLQEEHDSPCLLFYKGIADLNMSRIISIVGTRTPTAYGIRMTEELIEGLKPFNTLIVSGLAFGIDVAAHRKSLKINLPTVGVMGSGMQRIYPSQNVETALQMCSQGGVLTEYPSDEGPESKHFPMRNRIIAGMCDALIVVETAAKGGSMITAHMGLSYGKDIFAIAGRVGDKMSQGCHNLLKQRKAHFIESGADVASIMGWDEQGNNYNNKQTQLFPQLSDKEQIIVDILRKNDTGILIDALCFQSNISHSHIASLLLDLEFKGIVRSLPGKRYMLY